MVRCTETLLLDKQVDLAIRGSPTHHHPPIRISAHPPIRPSALAFFLQKA
jgi:hypothetical protein